jgi:hypothetical protein
MHCPVSYGWSWGLIPPGRAGALDSGRAAERSSTPTGRDRSWTVEFEVRYLTGADGDRLAARQADAIAALLTWVTRQASDGAREPAGSSRFARGLDRRIDPSRREAA